MAGAGTIPSLVLLREPRTLGLLCLALGLLCTGVVRSAERRLIRDLTAQAPLIVIGTVRGGEDFAQGAFSLHTLDVIETLKGSARGKLKLVEDRKSSLHIYHDGQRVLVFLDQAPTHSLYRKHLPPGAYFAAVGGKEGVMELEARADPVARALVEAYLAGDEEAARDPQLLRAELRSSQPRLAADAVSQLRGRSGLAQSLTKQDLKAVNSCLRDPLVGDKTRARLMRLLGEREVKAALPLLRALDPVAGELIAARARALTQLGEPPAAAQLEAYLRHPDPELRRFALEQLSRSSKKKAIRQLEAVALTDGDKNVRVAAVEALGASGRPEVTEVLVQVFNSRDSDLRRASARAFHKLGGPATQQALGDLVFDGERYEVQAHALVLLFSMGATKQDPMIERIRRQHPDKRIRRIIDEGIDFGAH